MTLPPQKAPESTTIASEGTTTAGGDEWTGTSRQYDDFHCKRIQSSNGLRIPTAAAIIEVDGLRLRIANPGRLAESPAAFVFLPRGSHAVCFRANETPVAVSIGSDFLAEYEAMRRFFGIGGAVRSPEVVNRSARAMDIHGAPFLLNFSGAQYVMAGQWDVAERKFRRALYISPLFSPAHLNLAECLVHRNCRDDAVREIELADIGNVGNVFGLAGAIGQMRRRLRLPAESREVIDFAAVSYVTTEKRSEEDLRLEALLEAIGKYAVREEERAKILNNLAIHFADSQRPELALHHFHNALAVVLHAGEGRYKLARQIFGHMSLVCRKAGFPEADEYRQMQSMVAP